jgi:hypothetical protein
VTPPAFSGETVGLSTEVWVPLSMQPEIYPGRDYLSLETKPFHKTEWLQAIGRLKQGVTIQQANASSRSCSRKPNRCLLRSGARF